MKTTIDAMIAVTGWAGSIPGITISINEIPDYIAGLNDKSLMIKFPSGSNGASVEKTIALDLTNHTEIVFHIWSRNKKRAGWDYNKSNDFAYKIEFGTGTVYYLPTFENFTDVTLSVEGITSITKVKITCLHNDEDYIILSNMIAVRDELPRDIYHAAKEHLESDINKFYGKILGGVQNKGISLGTVTAAVGDPSILLLNGLIFAEKYACIMIDNGVNTETHLIDHNDENEFYFSSEFDGKTIKYDHTNSNVYLVIPVGINLKENEIRLPGIGIWGMNPEEIFRSSKLDDSRDTFTTNETVKSRRVQANFKYQILIDCEARHDELVAYMSNVVRALIAREYLWINGKKIEIVSGGPSTYVDPTEGDNQIPKIQYLLNLEVKEEIYDRVSLTKTVENNLTVTIRR